MFCHLLTQLISFIAGQRLSADLNTVRQKWRRRGVSVFNAAEKSRSWRWIIAEMCACCTWHNRWWPHVYVSQQHLGCCCWPLELWLECVSVLHAHRTSDKRSLNSPSFKQLLLSFVKSFLLFYNVFSSVLLGLTQPHLYCRAWKYEFVTVNHFVFW